jgi:ribosomal protein S18 acetylase RimI-like enzyme
VTGPVLRPARPEDADFLVDLAGEAFAAYGDYRPLIAAWAGSPDVEVTLAEHAGARAGAAFLAFLQPGEAPHTKVADLLALAVVGRFRGRGLGRRLLAHAVARSREGARRHGLTVLRLNVAEGNASARRLFESAGFAYDDAEGLYPNGQKALHMSLDLRLAGRRRLI